MRLEVSSRVDGGKTYKRALLKSVRLEDNRDDAGTVACGGEVTGCEGGESNKEGASNSAVSASARIRNEGGGALGWSIDW